MSKFKLGDYVRRNNVTFEDSFGIPPTTTGVVVYLGNDLIGVNWNEASTPANYYPKESWGRFYFINERCIELDFRNVTNEILNKIKYLNTRYETRHQRI